MVSVEVSSYDCCVSGGAEQQIYVVAIADVPVTAVCGDDVYFGAI